MKEYNVLTYLHICGNVAPIIEMMTDTGVHCIEPLDPLGGMDIQEAKQAVKNRVSLMGGVNVLTVLNGKPDEIYQESMHCCKIAGREGGYILAAGDMVPDRSPKENIQAMVRAAHDFTYTQI